MPAGPRDPLADRVAAASEAEIVHGRHYTLWQRDIEKLAARRNRAADYQALALLTAIIDALERSSGLTGRSMPTWHTSTATWLARRDMWADRHQQAWERAREQP